MTRWVICGVPGPSGLGLSDPWEADMMIGRKLADRLARAFIDARRCETSEWTKAHQWACWPSCYPDALKSSILMMYGKQTARLTFAREYVGLDPEWNYWTDTAIAPRCLVGASQTSA